MHVDPDPAPVARPRCTASSRLFLCGMIAIFFFTGIGNASTFKQMPMIFERRQAGGVIGWTSAIAAFGPFFFGVGLAVANVTAFFTLGVVVRRGVHRAHLGPLRTTGRPQALLIPPTRRVPTPLRHGTRRHTLKDPHGHPHRLRPRLHHDRPAAAPAAPARAGRATQQRPCWTCARSRPPCGTPPCTARSARSRCRARSCWPHRTTRSRCSPSSRELHPGEFAVSYVERGPETWLLQFTRQQ